jgi:hypothetical protein
MYLQKVGNEQKFVVGILEVNDKNSRGSGGLMTLPFNGVPVGTYTGVCRQIILYLRDDDLVHAGQRVSKSVTGQIVFVFLIFKLINTGKYGFISC